MNLNHIPLKKIVIAYNYKIIFNKKKLILRFEISKIVLHLVGSKLQYTLNKI